jgi:adenine phosphoribosyltransferase
LLATGGTVTATSELIQEMGGIVAGFSFVVGLTFLKGIEKIAPISNNIIVLANY